jgi:predicted GH43/DUF377 family glycosyl hydrolase
MSWERIGLIFNSKNQSEWMVSHASNPTAINIKDDLFRIYFSCRNASKKASVGFIEIDLKDPKTILKISQSPAVSFGKIGLFDDSGISLGGIFKVEKRWFLYYVGWNLCQTVPWRNSIGLAISDDGLNFKKQGLAPVLDRSNLDPFSLSYPFVMKTEYGFKMWYGSNASWGSNPDDMIHGIRYAESADGIHWIPREEWSLFPDLISERAFSRPFVRIEN